MGIKYGNNGGSSWANNGGGGAGGGAGAVGKSVTSQYAHDIYGGVGVYKATINGIDYDFKYLFNLPSDNSIGQYHDGVSVYEDNSTYSEGVYFGGGGGGSVYHEGWSEENNAVGGLGGGGGFLGGTASPISARFTNLPLILGLESASCDEK